MTGEQILSQEFVKAHPTDVAILLEELPVEETLKFLWEIPPGLAAKVTKLISPLTAAVCLNQMDIDRAAAIIRELPIEIGISLLRRLDMSFRSSIFKMMPDEYSDSFGLLLEYPENTAGSLMNPQVFTLFDDVTVKEALKLILKNPKFVYYHIPVINRGQKFVGLTDISQLMLSKPEGLVSTVVSTGIGQLMPKSSREIILAHPDLQLYHELPVVDDKGVFLGIISYQVVRRLESEIQNSEQYAHASDAGKALGELYWIGMSALFKGAVSAVNFEKEKNL